MKIHKMLVLALLILSFIGATRCLAATEPLSDGWHKVQCEGVVIEYQTGLGPLARQLMPKALELAKNGPQAQYERQIKSLISRKSDILRFIAKQLGLGKPSKQHEKYFDAIGQVMLSLPSPKHLMLWNRQSLKEAVLSGKGPQGAKYDIAKDDFDFDLNAHWEDSDGNITVSDPYPISIPIDLSLSTPPLDQFQTSYDSSMIALGSDWLIHAFFHEVAETMVLFNPPPMGCYRRWLCDGVGEYLSEQCLGVFVSKTVMDDYMTKHDKWMEGYNPLREKVDLFAWRATEWSDEYPMDGDLCNAYYAFSEYEVRELVKRHGKDTLPKIFKEIRKMNANEGQDILDAIYKATGEDMSKRLSMYGANCPDPLRGLAIRKFCLESYSGDSKTQIADGSEVQITADDKHGISMVAKCSSLEYPLGIKWEITGVFDIKWVETTKERPKYVPDETYPFVTSRITEPFSSGRLKPGENILSLYLQGKLVKQVKFKLVEGGKL